MRRSIATQALSLLLMLLCFHVLSGSEVPTAPMEKPEQEALYSVIRGFVGEWWNGSQLYPDPCGWTPIQGVSCDLFDELWYITVLNIGPVLENSLECSQDVDFGPSLFALKHLKSLSFYNCFSSYRPTTVPARGWEKLSGSLETLEFRSNQGLVGEIPAGLGQLTNLQSLVLVENALTGALPQELGNLVHLKRLALAGNGFSGGIPASLGYNLNDLLILDLGRNSLIGPLPPSLGCLNSLLKLDLSSNLIDGKLPSELGKMRNLTLLDLRNNNFSGGLTQSLQGMVSLQDMLLSNNPLGGDLMEFGWQNLSNLTNLDLSNTGLSGEIPESITRLRRLRFLALDKNRLSGDVPPDLAALPGLNALYLNGNNLSGELKFSEGFYERLGRRFASWNNPNLCYSVGVVAATRHAPYGVEQCKDELEASNYDPDSEKKLGGGNPNQDSSFKASFGFSASSFNGLWWAVVVQELVVVFLLVLLL